MGFEEESNFEKSSKGSPRPSVTMTLQKAIDLGEYDSSYLATFAEWHTLSRHIQFQYIRTAIENRHRHLITQ